MENETFKSITLDTLPNDIFENILPFFNRSDVKNFKLVSKRLKNIYEVNQKKQFDNYANKLTKQTGIKWEAYHYWIRPNENDTFCMPQNGLRADKSKLDFFLTKLAERGIRRNITYATDNIYIYLDKLADINLILIDNPQELMTENNCESAIKLLNFGSENNWKLSYSMENGEIKRFHVTAYSKHKNEFSAVEIKEFKTKIMQGLPTSAEHISFWIPPNESHIRNKFISAEIHPFAIKIILEPLECLKDFASKLVKELYKTIPNHAVKLIEIAQINNIARVLKFINEIIKELEPDYNYKPDHPVRVLVLTLHALFYGKDISLTHSAWQKVDTDNLEYRKFLGQEVLDSVLSSLKLFEQVQAKDINSMAEQSTTSYKPR